jgi:hypothetical protein
VSCRRSGRAADGSHRPAHAYAIRPAGFRAREPRRELDQRGSHGQLTQRQEVTVLTIVLIVVVILLLFGGFGYSRRGRI